MHGGIMGVCTRISFSRGPYLKNLLHFLMSFVYTIQETLDDVVCLLHTLLDPALSRFCTLSSVIFAHRTCPWSQVGCPVSSFVHQFTEGRFDISLHYLSETLKPEPLLHFNSFLLLIVSAYSNHACI